MESILCFIALLATAYLIGVVRKFGVPESLSATYYSLGKKGWLFQLVMGTSGLLLAPVWMECAMDEWRFLAFLGCSGLLFTAVAPSFRMKLEGAVHYTAAVVCCVSAILWQVVEGLWDVTLLFAILGWMGFLQQRKWCFWLEVAVMSSVIANLWRLV